MSKFRIISEYNYFKPFRIQEDDDLDAPTTDAPESDDGLDAGFDDLDADAPDSSSEPTGDVPPVDDNMGGDAGLGTPDDDAVEIDVSSIVQKQEEMTTALNNITATFEKVIADTNRNFQQLTSAIKAQEEKSEAKVTELGSRIHDELVKRVPTPNESILVQTASSFPYNLKLSDYWKPAKNDEYKDSIANPNSGLYSKIVSQGEEIEKKSEEPAEYILTPKDVNDDYNTSKIERSF